MVSRMFCTCYDYLCNAVCVTKVMAFNRLKGKGDAVSVFDVDDGSG